MPRSESRCPFCTYARHPDLRHPLSGGGRDDQIAHVVVRTPTRLSERQEELLREFAALGGESVGMTQRSSLFTRIARAAARLWRTLAMSVATSVQCLGQVPPRA